MSDVYGSREAVDMYVKMKFYITFLRLMFKKKSGNPYDEE